MKAGAGISDSVARINHGFESDSEDNTLPGPPYYRIAIDSSVGLKSSDKDMEDPVTVNETVTKAAEPDSDKVEEVFLCGLAKPKFLLIVILCLADFLSLTCSSLHAPFYPRVALGKGASLVAAGFVFGLFQLTVFIACLFYGPLLARVGPKRMAMWGILAMAVSSVAFGFVDQIEGAGPFIAFSFLLRIIQANGNAAFITASFAVIAHEFPESVAKAISFMETASGMGLIVGPAVGGCLYELGGFVLPFVVTGILLVGAGVLTHFWVPSIVLPAEEDVKKEEKPRGMISLLMIPTVALAGFSILAGSSGIGYLLPTLEPHVHKNFEELSASFTGIIFIIDGAVYALFSPVWGYLCDNYGNPRIISLIGSVFIFMGFAVIGPIPFFPWNPILWVTCVGCAIFGLGLGATFVSAFVQALNDAKSHGFPDDVGTYGLVSGLWFSMMSLGCFVGSSAGGTLSEYLGFQHGSYFILFLQAFVAIWTIIFIVVYRNRKVNVDIESSPQQYIQTGEAAVA
ncbi:unnamed protein product [Allacma fusca]|uniref:Major facilitator superfamily (MFS) profile domain-containing protein n=1 Tax=Allacma fusca TaxID=39272 RepID=A0A8J2PZ50_9HEXA|nr:unnamed protein product [Allacma fusca]